jgi:hypothetical protein
MVFFNQQKMTEILNGISFLILFKFLNDFDWIRITWHHQQSSEYLLKCWKEFKLIWSISYPIWTNLQFQKMNWKKLF